MFARPINVLVLAFLGFIAGCGQSKSTDSDTAFNARTNDTPGEHADPHDIPLTDAEIEKLREDTASWAAAIDHIQQYRDKIKTETTGGTPAKAHRSLDLLDHVLQWLPEIAQNSNVPKADWQSIGENSQILRDAFNAVHANIDAGKNPNYESVAAEIDAAVAALAAIKPGEASGSDPK